MGESKEVTVEFEVESEVESSQKEMKQSHKKDTKEAKEVIESKAQGVADLKEKEPIPTIVVYHHPHHIEKQQSSRHMRENQHTYAPVGKWKDNQSIYAWRPTDTI
jgi:UDP-2,3-diacylglucosamine pyrophosphatase LpxH